MWEFFNSNFFVALTTIIAGTVAIFLYLRQKIDGKKDAAKIIYSEIVNAEEAVSKIKNIRHNQLLLQEEASKHILSKSSWSRLKHLFINDFDSNEWGKINLFFNQREMFNVTMKAITNLYPQNKEYRTKAIQEELAKLAIEHAKEFASVAPTRQDEQQKVIAKYESIAMTFKSIYIDIDNSYRYMYMPSGTFTFLDKDINTIDLNLSTSTVGDRLRKLSN